MPARLKPYPGKPDVRNFRGDAGNVVYGGIAHPPAIEQSGTRTLASRLKDARRQRGLPDEDGE